MRYVDVFNTLEEQIHTLGPNSLLPSEYQLAEKFGVSRVTVRRALRILEQAGLVSRRRGRGTVANPPKFMRHLIPPCTIEQDCREQGFSLKTRVVSYDRTAVPPGAICERLRLPEGRTVGLLSLTRIIDGFVISHDKRYLVPDIAVQFEPLEAEHRPVLDILERLAGRSIWAVDWETEICPVPPDATVALELRPGSLIVTNTGTDFVEGGRPVEVSVAYYRIDRVKFKFTASGISYKLSTPIHKGAEIPARGASDSP